MAGEIDARQVMVMAESLGVDVKGLAALTTREAKVRLILTWLEALPEGDPKFVLYWSILMGIGVNALVSVGADPLDALKAGVAGAKQHAAEVAAKVPRA
jgi:hypothetical protein